MKRVRVILHIDVPDKCSEPEARETLAEAIVNGDGKFVETAIDRDEYDPEDDEENQDEPSETPEYEF